MGGFGLSPYLLAKVKDWGARQEPQIFVNTPSDASVKLRSAVSCSLLLFVRFRWGAIAKGAVAHGLECLTMTRRRLPCHYGVHLDELFDPEKHRESASYIDQFDGLRRSSDSITWFAPMASPQSALPVLVVPSQPNHVRP